MRNKFIIAGMLIAGCILCTSCGMTQEEKEEYKQQQEDLANGIEGDTEPTVTLQQYNYIQIEVDEGPEGTFYTMPMYYQKDFKHISRGSLNIAENGNLITCLSMMDSQYSADYITPDKFLDKYKDFITDEGAYDKESLIRAVAEQNNRILTIEPLDVLKLPVYLETYNLNVLVHINHPSIYGDSSSYIVLTGITEDGNLYVRDPIYTNRKNIAKVYENGETVYSSFELFLEAGSDATVYVMGGGEYEFEEEDYKDISGLDRE